MDTPGKKVMDTMHVWIGTSSMSQDEFGQYFAINPVDRDAGVGASQFDKDLGTGWYDDDLIGVYYPSDTDELAAALDELPANSQALAEIEAKCADLGITKANALFYYNDSDLTVEDTTRKYNGLTYLGAFDNS